MNAIDETFRKLKKSPFCEVYSDIWAQWWSIDKRSVEEIIKEHNWAVEEYEQYKKINKT